MRRKSILWAAALLALCSCDTSDERPFWQIMEPIGHIRSPYTPDGERAPFQPVKGAAGEFRLEIAQRFADGLHRLDSFRYAYVLWAFDGREGEPKMLVHPPWAPPGIQVGVFASRSPMRPNPIGLSIVEIEKIEGNVVHCSSLDAYDGTPIYDLKPYIEELDTRESAGFGWVDELPEKEHLRLHIQGVPHEPGGEKPEKR